MRTELHFHLLHDVDDGPRDDGEAVDLARLAVADGTGRVVVTPHVRVLDLDQLPTRVEDLRARLLQASVLLVVCPGGELSPEDVASLRQEELETLAHGPPDRRGCCWRRRCRRPGRTFPLPPRNCTIAASLS